MARQLADFSVFIKNIDDKAEWIQHVEGHCTASLEFPGDAILFVGPRKSGKSTLINCLLDNTLKCVFDEATKYWNLENLIVRNSQISRQPTIAALEQSETLWPMSYKTRNITLWDMPGLHDNRGVQHEIKEAAMSRIVITNHRAVSFLLVVPESLVKQANLWPFVELINTFSQYSENIEDHAFIVISKTTTNNWQGILRRILDWNPTEDDTNASSINRAKEIVRAVIARNAGYSFKMPNYAVEHLNKRTYEHIYRFPDVDLIDKLDNVEKVNCSTCPYLLGIAAKLYLATQREMLNDVVKEKLKKICAIYETESKLEIETILERRTSKDARIDMIMCANSLLIKSNQWKMFLLTIPDIAPSSTFLHNLITDIISDFCVLVRCNQILGANNWAHLFDLIIQPTISKISADMDAGIMKIHQENGPKSSSSCIIQ